MRTDLQPCRGLSKQTRRQVMFGAAGAVAAALGLERAAFANVQQPLAAATFQPFIGGTFMVDDEGAPVGLRLLQVVTHPRGLRPSGLRNPFSLIFSKSLAEVLSSANLSREITQLQDDRYVHHAHFS